MNNSLHKYDIMVIYMALGAAKKCSDTLQHTAMALRRNSEAGKWISHCIKPLFCHGRLVTSLHLFHYYSSILVFSNVI